MSSANGTIQHLVLEEAEQAVIGSVLIDPKQIEVLSGYLKPEHFYMVRNRLIWEACLTCYTRNNASFDYLVVLQELKQTGKLEEVGGAPYITQLLNATPTSMYANTYGQLVWRAARRINLMVLSDTIRSMASDTSMSFEDVVAKVNAQVYAATGAVAYRPLPTMLELAREYMDKVEFLMNNPGKVTGLQTGFIDYDRLTLGLQPSDLIIIAGRPGMGKSALMLSMVLQALELKEGSHVALFSLEMPREQVVQRTASILGGVNLQTLRSGKLGQDEWARFVGAMGKVAKLKLHIDDTGGIKPAMMRSTCQRIQEQHGRLDLIVVDYLQLMSPDEASGNRTTDVGSISHALKQLARDFRCPVLAAAQLSRSCEMRADKRPILSDLRESGDIENDADIVTFVYRDEYYNPETEFPGQVELITAKHRNGPVGTVYMYFEKTLTKFYNGQRKTIDLKEVS